MIEQDDEALVKQCLEGNTGAFGKLVDRYQKPVFNAALRMVGDYDDAQDITQTAFVKAYEKLEGFNPKHRFFSWLYRIAVNESINLLKSRGRHHQLDHLMVSSEKTPEEQYGDQELDEKIQDSIGGLSIDYRVIIVLRHFAELSYRELSYVLDIPEKTVRSRLYTARQKLCEALTRRGIVTND